MLLAMSTVAVNAPENGTPVPGVARIVGLTITMYAIVKNVVTPPMTSACSARSGASRGSAIQIAHATIRLRAQSDRTTDEGHRRADPLSVGPRAPPCGHHDRWPRAGGGHYPNPGAAAHRGGMDRLCP